MPRKSRKPPWRPMFKRLKYDAMMYEAVAAFERQQPTTLAVDTETTGVGWHDRPFGMSLSWRDTEHPLRLRSYWLDFEHEPRGVAAALAILEQAPVLVMHNAKFDMQKLLLAGALVRDALTPERIEDTECLAHLLDENRVSKRLKHLAATELHEDTDESKRLNRVRRALGLRKEDGYHRLPREVIIPYALKDTEYTLRLWELYRPQLPEDMLTLYRNEMDLLLVLLDMEARGYRIDRPYVLEQAAQLGDEAERLRRELQRLLPFEATVLPPGAKAPNDGTRYWKPGAPEQVKDALEAITGRRPATTAESELRKLDLPFVEALLEYRKVHKFRETYFVNLLAETKREGDIWVAHPHTRPFAAKTGRMGSGEGTDG